LFETLKIPVLIDDGMDNSGEEDLLGLVGKKIHQVMHVVDLFVVSLVPLAPLGQELFT
jgi:hypothetical protein